jgi:hypothetical protein
MPVVVHLSNGKVENLRLAKSASWSPPASAQSSKHPVPRWLVCYGGRGEVVATFRESDVNGYKVERSIQSHRIRFPSWRKSVTA